MKGLYKIALIGTKVLEIIHWVGAAFMLVAAVCTGVAPQQLRYILDMNGEKEISSYGLEVTVIGADGELNKTAFILYCVGAVMLFSLMAMIFRNLYLIFKKSENSTPFQPDNVRMFREIGIFSISLPIVGLIMSSIIGLAVGFDVAQVSVSTNGFIMGIIVLCLTQFFAHGVELEKDVDGLL